MLILGLYDMISEKRWQEWEIFMLYQMVLSQKLSQRLSQRAETKVNKALPSKHWQRPQPHHEINTQST